MKYKLTEVLAQIAKGGPAEGCRIYEDTDTGRTEMPLDLFIEKQGKNLANFEVIRLNHNDLLMRWEIYVKEVKDERK